MEAISSMGHFNYLLQTIISIAENWLIKKTTPSMNNPFSSKVGAKTQLLEHLGEALEKWD